MDKVYYTVKDIAELLKVSKATVQGYINKLSIKPCRELNQRRFYSVNDTVKIIKSIDKDYDVSEMVDLDTAETAETGTAKTEKTTEQTTNSTVNTAETTEQTEKTASAIGESEILAKMVDMLQKQLEAKDKQIADLTRILEDTNRKLTETIKSQKYIEAVEKTQELQEYMSSQDENVPDPDQQEQEVVQEPKKKFSFFFWKNK